MPPIFFAIFGPLKIEQFRKKPMDAEGPAKPSIGRCFFLKMAQDAFFVIPGCHPSLSL
jgi:hypothetical protein